MTETKEEQSFLTEESRIAQQGNFHLFEARETDTEGGSQFPWDTFQRKCKAKIAGTKDEPRTELRQVSKQEIRENEEEYCGNCLTIAEEYDD